MLSTIERLILLKEVELFTLVPAEDLVPLAAVAQELTFPSGTTFIRQGESGDCLYLLMSGEVSIVVHNFGEVALRGPRSVIGEMSIITGEPRAADCVALSEVTVLKISAQNFWEMMEDRPSLAQGVIKVLAQRLTEAVANLKKVASPAEVSRL